MCALATGLPGRNTACRVGLLQDDPGDALIRWLQQAFPAHNVQRGGPRRARPGTTETPIVTRRSPRSPISSIMLGPARAAIHPTLRYRASEAESEPLLQGREQAGINNRALIHD